MKRHSDNETLIVDYLLGALPEAELQRFEQLYLGDETLFEELQEIEDELIDDYVSNALTAEQSAQFEEYFLRSAVRREKVEFARAMTEHAFDWKKERDANGPSASTPTKSADSGQPSELRGNVLPFKRWSRPVPAWRQWGAIAAAVLIAVGGGALWLRNRELRRELIASGSNEARLRQEVEERSATAEQLQAKVSITERANRELQEKLARMPNSLLEGGGKLVFSTLLRMGEMVIGGTRGGDEPKIKTLEIPVNTQSVHLNVEVDASKYRTFKTVLQRRGAEIPVFSRGGFRPGNKPNIALNIPANKMTDGDYILNLTGVTAEGKTESVGKYYLKVVRR